MFPVEGAILVEFKFFLGIPPVFFGGVIFPLTFTALQGHQFHRCLFARHILPLPVQKSGRFYLSIEAVPKLQFLEQP
jgi:hypothetical protein